MTLRSSHDLTHQQIAVLTDLPVPARQFATRAPGRPTMGFVEPLVTDRLVLRPWLVEDAAEALGIYGHPDVARWLSPEMDHVPDLAAMRLLLQQWVAEDDRTPPPAGRRAIDRRDDGRLAGRGAHPVAAAAGSGGPRGRLAAPSASTGVTATPVRPPAPSRAGRSVMTSTRSSRWSGRGTRAPRRPSADGMESVGETGKYFGLALQVFRLRRADFDPAAATSPMPPIPPPSD